MRIRTAATCGLDVSLDDHDPIEDEAALNVQIAVDEQDSLPIVSVQCHVTGDVYDREVAPAGIAGVLAIAPVGRHRPVARPPGRVGNGVDLIIATGQLDARACRQAGVAHVAELGERVGMDARVLLDRRGGGPPAGPAGAPPGTPAPAAAGLCGV